MKTPGGGHTTNYADTLITVAPDTRAVAGSPPPTGKGSVAERQFALLHGHDYELTSDDVLFTVSADRSGVPDDERHAAREAFFSTGQPCLRTSPLAKTYGWVSTSTPTAGSRSWPSTRPVTPNSSRTTP